MLGCCLGTMMFVALYPVERKPDNWAMDVSRHQQKTLSQGGQDGSLAYIFSQIGITNKRYVEFGFNSKEYGGTGPNTHLLWKQGWTGVLLDGQNENPAINLSKTWILPETIVSELHKRGVKDGTDYLSIDIDSADCFIMERIACEMKPRVMTVEYNPNYPLEATLANIGKEYRWRSDRYFGCGLGVHALIADKCGYVIVDVVAGLDVILVRKDLLGDSEYWPLEHWREFTNLNTHRWKGPGNEKFICDYAVYMKTRNLEDCIGEPVTRQLNALQYSYERGGSQTWSFTLES